MRHWRDFGPMLGRRRRRRASMGPTAGQCTMFAGNALLTVETDNADLDSDKRNDNMDTR